MKPYIYFIAIIGYFFQISAEEFCTNDSIPAAIEAENFFSHDDPVLSNDLEIELANNHHFDESFPLDVPRFLNINIISKKGSGLTRDLNILSNELKFLGHKVRHYHIGNFRPILKADINIFLETAEDFFFPYAKKNYIFPNPEWFKVSEQMIVEFDLILCKTREAERLFKKLNPNTVYTSFTSEDRLRKEIQTNYNIALHLAGKSQQKGTESVYKTWSQNSHFPGLFLISTHAKANDSPFWNLHSISEHLADAEIILFQNLAGLHICPSETEGFGHSIIEGLSCGAVVVTTDAPPMNEFVSDKRCLVAYKTIQKQNLAVNYYVDEISLAITLQELMNLSEDELIEIGKKNRDFYLKNDIFFKKKISEIFPSPDTFSPKLSVSNSPR